MYISLDSIKVNFEVFGKGEPILLLHGWGGSIESLKTLGQKIKTQGYTVLLIDLPGFGKSDNPNRDFSLDDYAEIVEEFLKQQGIDNLYVFGHSFGGSVAVKLALRKKIKVKKLILCNSSGIRQLKIKNEGLKIKGIGIIKEFFSLPGLRAIYPPLRKFFYYYILKNRDYIDYQKIAGTYKKVIGEDLTPQLKNIDISVLLLWGDKDRDTPIEHAKIFKSKIENCTLKIVRGEGHGLPKLKPELIMHDVISFVKGPTRLKP